MVDDESPNDRIPNDEVPVDEVPNDSVTGDSKVNEVLDANQRFYRAHENRDLDAMRAIWEHSERATCIHPGWPILRGWALVESGWQRILDGPGRNQFILTNQAVMIEGSLACVTLDENLVDTATAGTIAATNLFARSEAGEWKLILHHGSPVATTV